MWKLSTYFEDGKVMEYTVSWLRIESNQLHPQFYLLPNVLDLQELLKYASTRPTEVIQLVKRSPDFVGYTDACATGMGGVWFSGNENLDNLCWRVPFPKGYFWWSDIRCKSEGEAYQFRFRIGGGTGALWCPVFKHGHAQQVVGNLFWQQPYGSMVHKNGRQL